MEQAFSSFVQSPETLITNEIIKIVSGFVCEKSEKGTFWKKILCSFRDLFSRSWKVGILLFATYLVRNPGVFLEFLGKVSRFLFYKKIYLKNHEKEGSQGSAIESEANLYSKNNNIKGDPYFLVNSIPLYCSKHNQDEYKVEYVPFIHTPYMKKLNETVEKNYGELESKQKFVYKLLNGKNIEITNLFPSKNNKKICKIVSTFFRVSSLTRTFFTLGVLINGKEGIGKTESLSYVIQQKACQNGILIDMNKNLDIPFDDILKKIFSFSPKGSYIIYIDELDKYVDFYLKNEYRIASTPPKDHKKEDFFEPPSKEDFMQSKKEEFLMKLLSLIETRYFNDGVVFVFCANNFHTIFEGVNMKHFRSIYKRIHKIYFEECHSKEFKKYCRWYNKTLEKDATLYLSEEELEKELGRVKKDLSIPLREVFFANIESCFTIRKLVDLVNEWEEEDLSKLNTSPSSSTAKKEYPLKKFSLPDEKFSPVLEKKESSVLEKKETIFDIVKNNSKEKLHSLLEKSDVDVNAKNIHGNAPLHDAAIWDSKECLELLLHTDGIDVNAKNGFGGTSLHTAVLNKSKECLLLLLEAGANVNIRDKDGFTPLHYAVANNSLEYIELLLKCKGVDVNAKNDNGNTPLHVAAKNNFKVCLEILLKCEGIDVNAKDKYGHTPLHIAVLYKSKECIELLLKCEGVDVNAKNNDGNTPLSFSKEEIREILINHGAV
jgi:ankyrin repeat protein